MPWSSTLRCAFQSTHPRGVRQGMISGIVFPQPVSIHAPAWGATGPALHVTMQSGQVSIHAPAWGATCRRWKRFYRSSSCFNPRTRVGCDTPAFRACPSRPGFNPRTRVGCDADGFSVKPTTKLVSIHAPAWGATGHAGWARPCCRSFNPRTRVGCDLLALTPYRFLRCFNPRTRVGCDTPAFRACPSRPGFNPRTRVGCDADGFSVKPTTKLVSIHAPAWGATGHAGWARPCCRSFNPRTRVGCDLLALTPYRFLRCFNPRTRVGCDSPCGPLAPIFTQFQSTHPRGVRPSCPQLPSACLNRFNPRTRVGCDARLGLLAARLM